MLWPAPQDAFQGGDSATVSLRDQGAPGAPSDARRHMPKDQGETPVVISLDTAAAERHAADGRDITIRRALARSPHDPGALAQRLQLPGARM